MSHDSERERSGESAGGEVSETSQMQGGPSQDTPGDAVAGDPSQESGRTQEGSAGPNTVLGRDDSK